MRVVPSLAQHVLRSHKHTVLLLDVLIICFLTFCFHLRLHFSRFISLHVLIPVTINEFLLFFILTQDCYQSESFLFFSFFGPHHRVQSTFSLSLSLRSPWAPRVFKHLSPELCCRKHNTSQSSKRDIAHRLPSLIPTSYRPTTPTHPPTYLQHTIYHVFP